MAVNFLKKLLFLQDSLQNKTGELFANLEKLEDFTSLNKTIGDNLYRIKPFIHPESIGYGTFTFEEVGVYSPFTTHINSDGKYGLILLKNQIPVAICSFNIISNQLISVIQIQTIGRNKKLFNALDYAVWFLKVLNDIGKNLNLNQVQVQSVYNNKWRIENNPIPENRHIPIKQIYGSYDGAVNRFNKLYPESLIRI